MEVVPFGQDVITPAAGRAISRRRRLYVCPQDTASIFIFTPCTPQKFFHKGCFYP